MEMNDAQRDELLVRVDERVKTLTEVMRNHLYRHESTSGASRKMLAMIAVAVIAALGSLAAALAK